jgi:alpha-1,6-mannosyltransferase
MRPEPIASGTDPFTPRRHLRVVGDAAPRERLRVVDVALFHGERSGGIRTYLEAKARFASETRLIEHHLVIPGPALRHRGGRHELPSLRLAAANGYRLPLGAGALRRTLRELHPDVVLLHDPFWGPLGVTRTAQELGAPVVMVHHGSVGMDAAGLPGPDRAWAPALRGWRHAAYANADAVMSAIDAVPDCGRSASLPLRLGVHPAFAPPAISTGRTGEVLYAGRLAREKGVFTLLEAASRADERWSLRFMGAGPARDQLVRTAHRRGLARRFAVSPYEGDPTRLAARFARAGVVVVPGPHETFGLVALEAACSGAVVVVCETAPSADVVRAGGGTVETFAPGDPDALAAAISRARARTPDLRAAAGLAVRHAWHRVLRDEVADLERLVG